MRIRTVIGLPSRRISSVTSVPGLLSPTMYRKSSGDVTTRPFSFRMTSPGFNPGRGGPRFNVPDQGPVEVWNVELLGKTLIEWLNANTHKAARYLTVLDEVIHHVLGGVGGNGETDSNEPTFAAWPGVGTEDRGINTDHLPTHVHQGSSGISRINRGIRLDEILISLRSFDAHTATQSADDSLGHREVQSKRISKGHYGIADV